MRDFLLVANRQIRLRPFCGVSAWGRVCLCMALVGKVRVSFSGGLANGTR